MPLLEWRIERSGEVAGLVDWVGTVPVPGDSTSRLLPMLLPEGMVLGWVAPVCIVPERVPPCCMVPMLPLPLPDVEPLPVVVPLWAKEAVPNRVSAAARKILVCFIGLGECGRKCVRLLTWIFCKMLIQCLLTVELIFNQHNRGAAQPADLPEFGSLFFFTGCDYLMASCRLSSSAAQRCWRPIALILSWLASASTFGFSAHQPGSFVVPFNKSSTLIQPRLFSRLPTLH